MKKFLSLIACTLIIAASYCQPFAGLGLTNKGVNFQAGALISGIEITAAAKRPYSRNDIPLIYSLSVGKQILLTDNQEDNYSITPSIGYANYRIKDFTAYDKDPTGATGPVQISTFTPIYGLELGKDSYMGRVFISANYCKGLYFGMGIKIFPYRN